MIKRNEYQGEIALGKRIKVTTVATLDSVVELSQTVADTIQMISKVINIIGNLLRYTIIDMKTIRNSADKILSKENITRVKNESVLIDYTSLSKEELINPILDG